MAEWESSGRVKIERAKEHIGDLQTEIKSFFQRHPYAVVGEDDKETGDWIVRARINETPPLRWGAVAGDAIHNLRSSLDILWRLVMYPSGGGSTNRRIQFNVYDSADEFKTSHDREVHGPRKPAVDIYKGLKPYKGGNDLLWLLHAADVVDKHRGLIPAYSTVGTTIIDFSVGFRAPPRRLGLKWADPACPIEDGTELWRVKANMRGQVDMNPTFPFSIAFGEAEVLKAKPIISTLHQFAGVVEGIAQTFRVAGLLA